MVKIIQMTSEEVKELRETYSYDPLTGLVKFKKKRGPMPAGSIAGTINKNGYMQIKFKYRLYLLHRLAFVFMKGRLPEDYVDHIDRDRLNNKWENLRECSKTDNNRNRGVAKNNTSGITGVSFIPKSNKWQAYISYEEKMIKLGEYGTLEDASLARKNAENFYGYSVDKSDLVD